MSEELFIGEEKDGRYSEEVVGKDGKWVRKRGTERVTDVVMKDCV